MQSKQVVVDTWVFQAGVTMKGIEDVGASRLHCWVETVQYPQGILFVDGKITTMKKVSLKSGSADGCKVWKSSRRKDTQVESSCSVQN